MRAAVYARFSTERQRESSITDQFRLCQAAAEGRGWAVAVRHADDAGTWADMETTPAAQVAAGASLDVVAGARFVFRRRFRIC